MMTQFKDLNIAWSRVSLSLWETLLHAMQAFEARLWLAVEGSLSDVWRRYLSFWWLGQPNTSYCILSEERGNAV